MDIKLHVDKYKNINSETFDASANSKRAKPAEAKFECLSTKW